MRTHLAAVLAVTLACPLASAQDAPAKDTTTKLPFNPFADAKAGDWSTVVMVAAAGGQKRTAIWTWRVLSVGDDGAVKVQHEYAGRKDGVEHKGNPLSTKEAPTFARFFSEAIQDVQAPADEKATVDGKNFECKKVVFASENGSKKWTVLLAPEVKGSGLVTARVARGDQTMELNVVGFGTKEKTLWGKTAEQAMKDASEKPVVPEPAKVGPDLSTRDKCAEAVLAALKAGDKEAFKKCVTKRILDKHERNFDEWFEIWKKGCAEMTAETFAKKVKLLEEDGAWKLNEN
ncbi:MAG: hypothetical protein ACAI25_16020 [Planctomycetota bacterium]